MSFEKQQLDRLEWLLERPLASDKGSCAGFDKLSELHLREIARLAVPGRLLDAILYVRFLTAPPVSLRNAVSFVDNVITKDVAMSDWLAHYYHEE